MAGLLKCFTRKKQSSLPDPKDSLCDKIASSSISLVNDLVRDTLDEKARLDGKHGEYLIININSSTGSEVFSR